MRPPEFPVYSYKNPIYNQPWEHNWEHQISPPVEERYEPMVIVHQSFPISKASVLFCPCCSNPMEIKIRLEPCFHVICFDCFPLISERNDFCVVCNTKCTLAFLIHPSDEIQPCDSTCTNKGRIFLNSRSLACHEMLFHNCAEDQGEIETNQIKLLGNQGIEDEN